MREVQCAISPLSVTGGSSFVWLGKQQENTLKVVLIISTQQTPSAAEEATNDSVFETRQRPAMKVIQ